MKNKRGAARLSSTFKTKFCVVSFLNSNTQMFNRRGNSGWSKGEYLDSCFSYILTKFVQNRIRNKHSARPVGAMFGTKKDIDWQWVET